MKHNAGSQFWIILMWDLNQMAISFDGMYFSFVLSVFKDQVLMFV